MAGPSTWQQLLDPARFPPAPDAVLLPMVIGLAAALLGLLTVWRVLRPIGKPDGGLPVQDTLLALALGFTALLLPDIAGFVVTRNPEPDPMILGALQVAIAQVCIVLFARNPLRRQDEPAPAPSWIRFEPIWLARVLPAWALCYPVLIGAAVANAALLVVLDVPITEQHHLTRLRTDDSVPWILGWYVLAGVGAPLREEFAFRVVFFGVLKGWLSPAGSAGLWVAGSASVSLFVLAHYPWQFPVLILPLTALGVILTLSYAYTRSIWPGVIIHALHNSLVLTFQFFVAAD
ncbi:MAG: CPBP family intramembrane metalloprotease [Planctomycetes bacterium]|nr:CPBP family intramembrane metalloprotease [Planctomycetota bacterium]